MRWHRTWGRHGVAVVRRIQQPVAGVCRAVRGATWSSPRASGFAIRDGTEGSGSCWLVLERWERGERDGWILELQTEADLGVADV